MSTIGPEDEYWRRPHDEGAPSAAGSAPEGPAVPWRPGYQGPPPSTPPPPSWRPDIVVQPPPPRDLPQQDHADLDAQERSARTLTYGVGMVAGAVVLLVLCALCGRLVF